MALKTDKTECGHKPGRTGRKNSHREERKTGSRKKRRRADRRATEGVS